MTWVHSRSRLRPNTSSYYLVLIKNDMDNGVVRGWGGGGGGGGWCLVWKVINAVSVGNELEERHFNWRGCM